MLRGFGDRDTGPLTLPGRLGKAIFQQKNQSLICSYMCLYRMYADGRVLDHGQQTQIVQSAM